MKNSDLKFKLMMLNSGIESDVIRAIQELGYSSDKRAVPALFKLLKNEPIGHKRDQLVLALGHLHADTVVDYLVWLAQHPENRNKRGSILYALTDLDCKDHFGAIVDFICYGDYEVQHHAITILVEQFLKVLSNKDRTLALRKLRKVANNELKNPNVDKGEYSNLYMINTAISVLDGKEVK